MDFNEGMDHLSQLCKGKDWFYDISTDNLGRIVVYVKFMNQETLHLPDTVAGKQVVVHFAGSLLAKRDNFVNNESAKHPLLNVQRLPEDNAKLPVSGPLITNATSFGKPVAEPVELENLEDIMDVSTDDQSLRHLQNELDRLEKVCGSHTLQDIFYESHDGKNAVTNMSKHYVDVRKSMDKLIQEYGFDVIYEELDG